MRRVPEPLDMTGLRSILRKSGEEYVRSSRDSTPAAGLLNLKMALLVIHRSSCQASTLCQKRTFLGQRLTLTSHRLVFFRHTVIPHPHDLFQKATCFKPCIQNRLSSAAELMDAGNSGSGCSEKIFCANCLPTNCAAEVLICLCW